MDGSLDDVAEFTALLLSDQGEASGSKCLLSRFLSISRFVGDGGTDSCC